MPPQMACLGRCIVTLIAFVWLFSAVRFQMSPEKMQSHIGCICLTFLRRVFSNVSSNCLPEKMQSHIGHIYSTFLHCAFSNVSSNCLPVMMHSHTGCICLTLWTFQSFSSWFLHLNPLNKSHDFQEFGPLLLCVVLCPNGCFKLRKFYDWLLVSINYKHTFTFFIHYWEAEVCCW